VKWICKEYHDNTEMSLLIIDVFEHLGNKDAKNEIINYILENTNTDISQYAKNSLIRAGYSCSLKRIELHDLLEKLADQENDARNKILSLEENHRSAIMRIKELEILYRNYRQKLDILAIERIILTSEFNANQLRYEVKKIQEEQNIDRLYRRASGIETQMSTRLSSVSLDGKSTEYYSSIVQQIDVAIVSVNEKVNNKKAELKKIEDNINELRAISLTTEISVSDAFVQERRINQQKTDVKINNMEVSFREQLLKEYGNILSQWDSRISNIRQEVIKQNNLLNKNSNNSIKGNSNNLEQILSNIQNCRSTINEMDAEVTRIRVKIDTALKQSEDVANHLQTDIDKIQKQIMNLSEDDSRIKRDIEDQITRQQHLKQKIDEEKKAYEIYKSRAEYQNVIVHDMAENRAKYYKELKILGDEAYQHVDLTIEKVFEERFQEEESNRIEEISQMLGRKLI
jgi:chromosome segregation ATPase